MRCGTRVIWRKLDCLNLNLQTTQAAVRRKDACNRRRVPHWLGAMVGATSRARSDAQFVETALMPHYTRGHRRAHNGAYRRVQEAITRARARDDRAAVRSLRKQHRDLPSVDPQDPDHRRLRYVRYADDTLLGFTGPRAEAEEIKQRLAAFLRDDLKLELSHDKTLITHARTEAARFLGYKITVAHNNSLIIGGRRWSTARSDSGCPPR
jgi:hypothetical protein